MSGKTKAELEAELRELKTRGVAAVGEAVEHVEEAAPAVRHWAERFAHLPVRALVAVAVLGAVALALVFLVEDAAGLGGWIAEHAAWSVQVAWVAAAAVLVCAAFLLLQITVLDPLLIGPEVRKTFLGWHRRYEAGERSEEDGSMILAGAIYAGCVVLMMGILAFGVFWAAGAT